MKLLFWKEFRETRVIVLFASVLVVVLFLGAGIIRPLLYPYSHSQKVEESVVETVIGLVWGLTASLAGAMIVAPEVGSGSLLFLDSLPISRNKVWWTKVAAAFSVYLLAFVASGLTYDVCYWLAAKAGCVVSPDYQSELTNQFIYLLASPFPFAVGCVVTTLVDRSINALMITIVTTIALAAAIFAAANFIQLRDTPSGTDYGMWGMFALMTIACLATSHRIFVHGESLKTIKRFKLLVVSGLGDLIIISSALVVAYFWIVS